MHHASLAFKEMSEIRLGSTDVGQSKISFANSNQISKDLSVNLPRNRSMKDEEIPLASIVQETSLNDQMQDSSQSSVITAKNEERSNLVARSEVINVQKLADDGNVDDISKSKESLDCFSSTKINEPPVQRQNLGNYDVV